MWNDDKELRLSAEERAYLDYAKRWEADEGAYMALQRTRPQTLAYGLSDSPAGLAAWLFEKWRAWTVPTGGGWDGALTETLLATLTLYWATNTISTANRTYASPRTPARALTPTDRLTQPVGVLVTAQRIERAPRTLAERVSRSYGSGPTSTATATLSARKPPPRSPHRSDCFFSVHGRDRIPSCHIVVPACRYSGTSLGQTTIRLKPAKFN